MARWQRAIAHIDSEALQHSNTTGRGARAIGTRTGSFANARKVTQSTRMTFVQSDFVYLRALCVFVIGRRPPDAAYEMAPSQLVVKAWRHSTGEASPLAALFPAQIPPVFSVVAPCQRGASPVSVRRQPFTTRLDVWVVT